MAYELEFEDTFGGGSLDRRRWLPFYLPQWSSRERAAARYELTDGRLRLLITHDQEPWCPELDGEVRVSSLQTGTPEQVSFEVGGEPVKAVRQSPAYPMQLMLGIYEFPREHERPPEAYPKAFVVDWVRG